MKNRIAIKDMDTSIYEADFSIWLETQSAALRGKKIEEIDFANLAEEIEDLGKSLKREVESRLETLITHLIKLSVSKQEEPKAGWKATVREQRRQLEKLFRDSPSLRRYADEVYRECLIAAKNEAYLSMKDYEPANAEQYEKSIKASWDLIEFELILDQGHYFDIVEIT